MSEMVIVQLYYLVPINCTGEVMIPWLQDSPVSILENLFLAGRVLILLTEGIEYFFPHKSQWIVLSQMLQVHKAAISRNRLSRLRGILSWWCLSWSGYDLAVWCLKLNSKIHIVVFTNSLISSGPKKTQLLSAVQLIQYTGLHLVTKQMSQN